MPSSCPNPSVFHRRIFPLVRRPPRTSDCTIWPSQTWRSACWPWQLLVLRSWMSFPSSCWLVSLWLVVINWILSAVTKLGDMLRMNMFSVMWGFGSGFLGIVLDLMDCICHGRIQHNVEWTSITLVNNLKDLTLKQLTSTFWSCRFDCFRLMNSNNCRYHCNHNFFHRPN